MPQKRLKQSEVSKLTGTADLLHDIGTCFNDAEATKLAELVLLVVEKYGDEEPSQPTAPTEPAK